VSKEGACEYKESWNLSAKPVPDHNVPHRTDLLTRSVHGALPISDDFVRTNELIGERSIILNLASFPGPPGLLNEGCSVIVSPSRRRIQVTRPISPMFSEGTCQVDAGVAAERMPYCLVNAGHISALTQLWRWLPRGFLKHKLCLVAAKKDTW
jgi:hypothetical protein